MRIDNYLAKQRIAPSLKVTVNKYMQVAS